MAFKNKLMTEADKQKVASIITLEAVRKRMYAHKLQDFRDWTVDEDRDAYLVYLIGSNPEMPPPGYALGLKDEFVLFRLTKKGSGNDTVGIVKEWYVSDLIIPTSLQTQTEAIKQLIAEALEEMAYFDPFTDGGTYAHPNMDARTKNIISFHVEFI